MFCEERHEMSLSTCCDDHLDVPCEEREPVNAPLQTQPRTTSRSADAPGRTGALQRKCACGGAPGPTGECTACRRKRMHGAKPLPLQPKLTVNQPNDQYEQEADRVADQVMRMAALPMKQAENGSIKETEEQIEELPTTSMVQRKVGNRDTDDEAPPIVHEVLQAQGASVGQPLDASTRGFMEASFGHDFSQVRIHVDSKASASANAVNAKAYTVGHVIVFNAGQFAPSTSTGQQLLAHELTHVLQQTAAPPKSILARQNSLSPTPIHVLQRNGGEEQSGETGQLTEISDDVPILWFDFDSTVLRQDAQENSEVRLTVISLQILNHQTLFPKDWAIVLHGYASEEGSAGYNQSLSEKRAIAIRERLDAFGISKQRISVVGHGKDSSVEDRAWNRRVEVEFIPPAQYVELEGMHIKGRVPRSTPVPPEETGGLTKRHVAIREQARIPVEQTEEWSTWQSLEMAWERNTSSTGRSESTVQYKNEWVRVHRAIIKNAAAQHDLPTWLLAGVAWIEVGGEPAWTDDLSHILKRDFGISGDRPEHTSYGPIAIQIRRAAEELGYDPENLNKIQISLIIDSLRDPQQNIFIVASHLDRLRNIDFPAKPAEMLTDDEIRVIGARYNRGPDLSLQDIQKDTSYGNLIVQKKDELQNLLED